MRSQKLTYGFVLFIFSTYGMASFVPQKVSAGREHTCAISSDGRVKCWGANYYGQLGLGNRDEHGPAPDSMGKNLPVTNLGTNVVVKDMCTGTDFSCAITGEQKLKCWGSNNLGQLGIGTTVSAIGIDPKQMGDALPYVNLGTDFRVQKVACGYNHACALNQDGKVKCWGYNVKGQLGTESANPTRGSKPEEMGDGLPFVIEEQKFSSITVGAGFSCGLLADGNFKCWGDNSYSMLGIETRESHGAKTGSMGANLPAVKLEKGPYTGLAIASGYVHTCATYLYEGRKKLKCWGYNVEGRLGAGIQSGDLGGTPDSMGDKLPETVTGIDSIRDIAALGTFTCAMGGGGKIKCWGGNSQGQLGIGDSRARGSMATDMGQNLPFIDLGLPVRALSTGSVGNHACAILANNLVKCWGYNGDGQLGYGDRMARGAGPDDMGENLFYVKLD